MISRDEIITTLTKKFDPRSISWEFRAILDVLQDDEPVTAKELECAVNEKYGCDLFTYKQVYDILQVMAKQNIVINNLVTKQYTIFPEYRTKDVQFLPISTYSVILFLLSVTYMASTVIFKYGESIISVGIVLIGAMYLLAQYVGAEFKLENGWKQFVPKPFEFNKKPTEETPHKEN